MKARNAVLLLTAIALLCAPTAMAASAANASDPHLYDCTGDPLNPFGDPANLPDCVEYTSDATFAVLNFVVSFVQELIRDN